MSVQPIPDGCHTLTPFLMVADAAAAIQFPQAAVGATELFRVHDGQGQIMHAVVRIGDSIVMMGEARERCPAMPAQIDRYVTDADAVYRAPLDAGAESLMEPANQFWGDRMGDVRDPSGNHWLIATHVEDVVFGELERRARAYPE